MSQTPMPTLYLVAGPNGAGKSSLAGSLLPHSVPAERFVNPDVIAASLEPVGSARALLDAGKRALERVRAFETSRSSFALETTLSGQWTTRLVRRLLTEGWGVDLTFLWLPSGDAAIARVRSRAERAGGHGIPDEDVRRRYGRGLANFAALRTEVSWWRVVDRRRIPDARLIVEGEGDAITIHDSAAWTEVLRSVDAATGRADRGQPPRLGERPALFDPGSGDTRGEARLRRLLRAEIDLAIAVADRATVLRHRGLAIPLVFCEDGSTLEVDPWRVSLPAVPAIGSGDASR